jgi:hypothetical protein
MGKRKYVLPLEASVKTEASKPSKTMKLTYYLMAQKLAFKTGREELKI